MTTERLLPAACFSCGKVKDRCDGFNTADTPVPGDLDVCLYCSAIGVFEMVAGILRAREATMGEITALDADTREQLQSAVRMTTRARERRA